MLADIPLRVQAESRQRWYDALGFVPKLGQRLADEAVDRGARFVGLFTPAQDGKSYWCAKHIGSALLFPDVHIWVVAPTYQDGSKEFGYLYQDLNVMGLLKSAKRKFFDIRGGNMHIELKNGSWAQVISAENPESLRREQLDIVVPAEASKLPENLYDRFLYSRVERRNGRVLVPTTHKGYGWVWDRFAVRAMPMKPKTFAWSPWVEDRRFPVGGDPNPLYDPEHFACQVSYVEEFGDVLHHPVEFPPEKIALARKRLSPPQFAEQFGGEAASYTGLVYRFDALRHEVPAFDVPRDWPVIAGWDHGAGGGSDPTVITLRSLAPDGTSYYWGEIYDEAVHTTRDRVGLLKIKLHNRALAYPIMRGGDAKQIGTELAECGLPSTFPTTTSVEGRIMRVTDRLGDGKIKLLAGRMPRTKAGFLAYEWDEKHPGKPREGQDDHALESLGYNELASIAQPVGAMPAATTGESRAVREEWQSFRDRMDQMDALKERLSLAGILDETPWDVEEAGMGRRYTA